MSIILYNYGVRHQFQLQCLIIIAAAGVDFKSSVFLSICALSASIPKSLQNEATLSLIQDIQNIKLICNDISPYQEAQMRLSY